VFQDCILKLYEKNHKAVPESLDLPTVCKQTYAEAIGIYYRNVTIGWWYFSTFEGWTERLPRTVIQQIPKIQLVDRRADCSGEKLVHRLSFGFDCRVCISNAFGPVRYFRFVVGFQTIRHARLPFPMV
jgi:hypothetical protein